MKRNPVAFAAAAVAVALACAFHAAPAVAQTYTVTESGTWAAGTPTVTDFSAAGETWSYSFEVSAMPTVYFSNGSVSDTDVTDFVYTLDGIPESLSLLPNFISWEAAGYGGGIYFELSNGALFTVNADQLFSGAPSSPTIVPGDYAVSNTSYVQFPSPNSGTTESLSGFLDIPEGGAPWLYLLLGALACWGGVFLKSRAGWRMGTLN